MLSLLKKVYFNAYFYIYIHICTYTEFLLGDQSLAISRKSQNNSIFRNDKMSKSLVFESHHWKVFQNAFLSHACGCSCSIQSLAIFLMPLRQYYATLTKNYNYFTTIKLLNTETMTSYLETS